MSNMAGLAHRVLEPFIEETLSPFEAVGHWHRQLGRIALAMQTAKMSHTWRQSNILMKIWSSS